MKKKSIEAVIKQCRLRIHYLESIWKSAFSENKIPQFDKFLSHYFAHHKQFGSHDRKFYSEILFSCLRFGTLALSLCGQKPKNKEEFLLAFQTVRFEQFLNFVLLKYNDVFSQENIQDLFSQEILNQYLFFKKKSTPLDHLTVTLQDYFLKRVQYSQWTEEEKNNFLNGLSTKPPLWIRVNDISKMEDVFKEFSDLNSKIFLSPNSKNSFYVESSTSIYEMKSFQKGFFEIQDFASQEIGNKISCQKGHFIWDACAGGGGKTMQIASKLNGSGAVFASDIREYKLEETKKRAKRAQFHNVRTLVWDGKTLPQFPKEISLRGGFHTVFIDAPCTSLGTLRRNPDVSFRFSVDYLEEIVRIQNQLLTICSRAVAKNGKLVYATCSFLLEENEYQIEKFLSENSDFTLLEQSLVGHPRENSDVMFVAVLEKKN